MAPPLDALMVDMPLILVVSKLKSKADDMLQKFDKYWAGMKNINKMLIVATVFDPRKNMQFAKMCFEKLYGKESSDAKEMYQSLVDVLRFMFKEYSARFDRGEAFQASQTTPAASFGSQEASFERINLINNEIGYERMDFMYEELVGEIEDRESKGELDTYLRGSVVNPRTMLGVEYDVLSWWKFNAKVPGSCRNCKRCTCNASLVSCF